MNLNMFNTPQSSSIRRLFTGESSTGKSSTGKSSTVDPSTGDPSTGELSTSALIDVNDDDDDKYLKTSLHLNCESDYIKYKEVETKVFTIMREWILVLFAVLSLISVLHLWLKNNHVGAAVIAEYLDYILFFVAIAFCIASLDSYMNLFILRHTLADVCRTISNHVQTGDGSQPRLTRNYKSIKIAANLSKIFQWAIPTLYVGALILFFMIGSSYARDFKEGPLPCKEVLRPHHASSDKLPFRPEPPIFTAHIVALLKRHHEPLENANIEALDEPDWAFNPNFSLFRWVSSNVRYLALWTPF